jgi:hypothetical protein
VFCGVLMLCAFDVQCTNNALHTKGVSVKSSNLTVRIEPGLKREAQEAAAALDVSLSQVVTAALRGLLRESERYKSWVGEFGGYAQPSPSQVVELSAEALAEGVGRGKIFDRLTELQDRERRNTLNKDTRRELAHLRKLQASM